jgi:glutathione peroxidase
VAPPDTDDSQYSGSGLEILAVPCNQFGGQEPGSHEDIKKFVEDKYHVTFPLFSKVCTRSRGQGARARHAPSAGGTQPGLSAWQVNVNGPSANSLFTYLKANALAKGSPFDIQWNFSKWLRRGDASRLRKGV